MRHSIPCASLCLLVAALIPLWGGCSFEDSSETESAGSAELKRQMIPQEARSHLVRASDALQQGAYHRALALVDSAEQVQPDLADAGYVRGRAYTELKQFEKANAAYEKVLSLEPTYQGIRLNLGNNAFRQGRFRDALAWYQQEREHYPSARLWLHMGRAYNQLEKPDSASYAFRNVINYDAESTDPSIRADAHIRLAQVLEDQGKVEDGLTHARRAVDLAPDRVTYRYVLGSLLYQSGETEAAVEELERVVEADSTHQSAHYRLGQALIRLGQEDRAQFYLDKADSLQQIDEEIDQLRTLAEQNPDHPKWWLELGEALRDAGRTEAAMEAYQVVLSMNPQNLPLQMTLANLALRAGNSAQAARRYQAVLQQDSTFTDAWVNLGVAYATSGQPERARTAWERALKLEPDNERVKSYLARLSRGP